MADVQIKTLASFATILETEAEHGANQRPTEICGRTQEKVEQSGRGAPIKNSPHAAMLYDGLRVGSEMFQIC